MEILYLGGGGRFRLLEVWAFLGIYTYMCMRVERKKNPPFGAEFEPRREKKASFDRTDSSVAGCQLRCVAENSLKEN